MGNQVERLGVFCNCNKSEDRAKKLFSFSFQSDFDPGFDFIRQHHNWQKVDYNQLLQVSSRSSSLAFLHRNYSISG